MPFCASCGANNADGAKFCAGCGAVQTPGGPPLPAAPPSYVPQQTQMTQVCNYQYLFLPSFVSSLFFSPSFFPFPFPSNARCPVVRVFTFDPLTLTFLFQLQEQMNQQVYRIIYYDNIFVLLISSVEV